MCDFILLCAFKISDNVTGKDFDIFIFNFSILTTPDNNWLNAAQLLNFAQNKHLADDENYLPWMTSRPKAVQKKIEQNRILLGQ